VATYNVHRFFDTWCESGRCAPGDYEEAPAAEQFEARADTIAAALASLDADVVVLQEVESQACLDALASRLGGAFPVAVLGELGWAASVDVAILANVELVDTRGHRNVPLHRADGGVTWFARELVELRLGWEGRPVAVFGAHFRSMVNDDPERRLLEARATRAAMEATAAELPGALVLLAGDLNDVPGSSTLDALEADGGMWRVGSELTAADAVTWGSGVSARAFDHLYVVPGARSHYLPGSVRVVRSAGRSGLGDSDHAAVAAGFRPPP
jgi:endonuclease/exonuclease/phosphatase family metal-dependent hydrolase